MELKPIPVDSGDFTEIRTAEKPMVYADKTACFHRLIADPQARRQRSAAPCAAAGKPVRAIGLAFAKRARRLVGHCVKRFR